MLESSGHALLGVLSPTLSRSSSPSTMTWAALKSKRMKDRAKVSLSPVGLKAIHTRPSRLVNSRKERDSNSGLSWIEGPELPPYSIPWGTGRIAGRWGWCRRCKESHSSVPRD